LDREQFERLWAGMGNKESELSHVLNVIDKNCDNNISFLELALVFGFIDGKGELDNNYFAKLWTSKSTMDDIIEVKTTNSNTINVPMMKKRSGSVMGSQPPSTPPPKQDTVNHDSKILELQKENESTLAKNNELQQQVSQLRFQLDEARRRNVEIETKFKNDMQQLVTDDQMVRNLQKENAFLKRELERVREEYMQLRANTNKPQDTVTKSYDSLSVEFREYRIKQQEIDRKNSDQIAALNNALIEEQRRSERAEIEHQEFKSQCTCKTATEENSMLKDRLRSLEESMMQYLDDEVNESKSPFKPPMLSPRGNSPSNNAWNKVHLLVGCTWRKDTLPPNFHISRDGRSVKCKESYNDYMIVGNMIAKPNAMTYWEVESRSKPGDKFFVGAVEEKTSSHVDHQRGWMLCSDGYLFDSGKQLQTQYCENFCGYHVRIGVLLDLTRGYITFFKGGQPLGVAFKNVTGAIRPSVIHCGKRY
jgi:hypothetical protein